MLNRITGQLDFQADALTLRAERQRLIAGNIANADTPGYLARDFDFARALREAAAGGARMAATQAGHLQQASGAAAPANLSYAVPAQSNLDGNSVDMDRERASFADNAVKYEATLRFINASVRTTLEAMRSPNQG
jgi:flagellar basal-body rod protein FlgB